MKKVYWKSLAAGLGIMIGLGGCATAPKQAAAPTSAPPPGLAPLELFWNGQDNLTVAFPAGVAAAKKSGYNFVRVEGYVFADPQTGTVPLEQYWSEKRQDNMLLSKPLPPVLRRNAGYQLVRVEGYAYPQPHAGTVPLKRFKKPGSDNFSTATAQGENDAISAGYSLDQIEAYIFPASGTQPMVSSAPEPPSTVSARQIQKWITQLRGPDYAMREGAVKELAKYPEQALLALEQALKKEKGEDERWWIRSAIQECSNH